jgi:hypothetical protein
MAVSNVNNAWTQSTTSVNEGKGTSITVEIRKAGLMVVVTFINGSFTATADQSIITIPTGYRPNRKIDVLDTYGKKRLLIDTDGTVVTKETLSAEPIRGSFTYIAQ